MAKVVDECFNKDDVLTFVLVEQMVEVIKTMYEETELAKMSKLSLEASKKDVAEKEEAKVVDKDDVDVSSTAETESSEKSEV